MNAMPRTLLGLCLAIGIMSVSFAKDTIRTGFIAPFSGPFAPRGEAFLKGLRFSLESVNRSGGALGHQRASTAW